MTTRQLRDIASYVGAPYTVEVYDRNVNKSGWPYEWQQKKGQGLTLLTNLVLVSLEDGVDPAIRNIKLHLRRLESLTEVERQYCLQLAGRKNGNIMIEYNTVVYYDSSSLINTNCIIAYLQSIGVYVPGTIDEQFVELT